MRVGAMKEEKKIRKKIKIEDLLPRDPIRVDLDAILGYVKGKTDVDLYLLSWKRIRMLCSILSKDAKRKKCCFM